jgi:hypothetical protein
LDGVMWYTSQPRGVTTTSELHAHILRTVQTMSNSGTTNRRNLDVALNHFDMLQTALVDDGVLPTETVAPWNAERFCLVFSDRGGHLDGIKALRLYEPVHRLHLISGRILKDLGVDGTVVCHMANIAAADPMFCAWLQKEAKVETKALLFAHATTGRFGTCLAGAFVLQQMVAGKTLVRWLKEFFESNPSVTSSSALKQRALEFANNTVQCRKLTLLSDYFARVFYPLLRIFYRYGKMKSSEERGIAWQRQLFLGIAQKLSRVRSLPQ